MATIKILENNYNNDYTVVVEGSNAKRELKKILVKAFGNNEADYIINYGMVDTFNNKVYVELRLDQIRALGL